ncbi:MAG: hypothetical protein ACYSUV_12475 [Planctomycetota bacterium]|jgi:Tfp pilus assembly protein PilN
MFTVDLFKGEAIPAKSGPRRIVVVAVALAVPLVVAALMVGAYLSNRIDIGISRVQMAKYQADEVELAGVLNAQREFEQRKNSINSCLAEVSSAVKMRAQWSPILRSIAENIPASVVLTRLEARRENVRIKQPAKDDPAKTENVSVPVRTLKMSIRCKPDSGCDRAISDFRNTMRSSELLGARLDDINPSQSSTTFEGEDAVAYEIDFIFKPGM